MMHTRNSCLLSCHKICGVVLAQLLFIVSCNCWVVPLHLPLAYPHRHLWVTILGALYWCQPRQAQVRANVWCHAICWLDVCQCTTSFIIHHVAWLLLIVYCHQGLQLNTVHLKWTCSGVVFKSLCHVTSNAWSFTTPKTVRSPKLLPWTIRTIKLSTYVWAYGTYFRIKSSCKNDHSHT